MRSYVHRSVLVALLLSLALFQACSSNDKVQPSTEPTAQATASAFDPGAPGPYPVGVTEITFERKSTTTGEPRTLKTLIWYPADESAKTQPEEVTLHGVIDAKLTNDNLPLPIIMFSHGSGGLPWQSTFYTAHLASHGFVVVAPPHPGNTAADCLPCTDSNGLVDSYLNRPTDITFVLESMLKLDDDPRSLFYQTLDGTRVGISGHSFGGLVTVQLVAGSSGPFSAALAMAPALGNGAPTPTGPVQVPLMIMGGGKDKTCPVDKDRTYLDSLDGSSPHFLVVLLSGGHLSFADQCFAILGGCGPDDISQEKAHQLINSYATAFFKTYVAGESGYERYLEPEAAEGNPDIEYTAVLP
jgi:predicted dienelactone hydrolase